MVETQRIIAEERRQKQGVFEKIFAELTKDEIREEWSLESTFVKVHRHGLGVKRGSKDIQEKVKAVTTQKFMLQSMNFVDRLNCF